MKSLREQIANRCFFFNGVQHDCCKAEVKYNDLASPLPCLRSLGEATACVKRRWLTEEEIQSEIAEAEAAGAMFDTVLPLIQKIKREHKGESWKGVEVCPVCKGKLHMRIAGCNGHVWGRCETKDCLSWME